MDDGTFQPRAAILEAEEPVAETARHLMRALLEAPRSASPAGAALPSVVVGELVAFADHLPLVRFRAMGDARRQLLPARSLVALDASFIGSEVTLAFENGQVELPIVMGVLQPCVALADQGVDGLSASSKAATGTLAFSAEEQLVLQCGKASLTLTRAGKVLIRGEYVSTHSSGLTRIRGGAIQLN
ncbi:conserved hypothetical protein [Burkholderiales bacterium 8X]|nr:conserved hypothetical protein [Burkholderiales bacterium 8X]